MCPYVGCGRVLKVMSDNNGFTPPDPSWPEFRFDCPVHGDVEPYQPTDDGLPLYSIAHTPEMWEKIEKGLPGLIKKINDKHKK